ncbi:MAG: tripartite tricarboxylate transporter substrate-binding protein [Beijerinckiaceae bacterium]|nr:tripartite tricarboxylate transporter substrate-binding protein [Beijerinckiaceae bacterium]
MDRMGLWRHGPIAWMGAALLMAILAGAPPLQAQTTPDFYAGKTISMTVGYAPGGIYDINARLTAKYLTKHLPGHPTVIVRNVPGAGGLTQANQLYNVAARDGTEIGIIGRAAPQLAVLGEPGPRFDPAGFNWIGSSSSYQDDAYILFVRSDMGLASFEAALSTKKKINFGAGGPGSSNLSFGNIASDVLGLNLSIIKGYAGAAPIVLAMQTGELDSTVMGYSSIRAGQRDLLDSKRIVGLVQFGRTTRHPEFPDTPTARESAKTENDRVLIELAEAPFFMALPFAAPPGVPADRVALLRTAFMQLHLDPDYLAEAKKLDLDVSPLDGEAVQALIQRMTQTPKPVIERFKAIMNK